MKKAFLILITIIGLLIVAIVVLSQLHSLPFPGSQYEERSTIEELKMFDVILKDFKQACGRYPTSQEGLIALKVKPKDLACPGYPVPSFVKNEFTFNDVWGQPFRYSSDGNHYRLESSHGHFKESE